MKGENDEESKLSHGNRCGHCYNGKVYAGKGRGEDFDPVFYAETYEDVAAALGTDADALYNHYINFGQKEGRFPNVDLIQPGSENLRELLKDIPMNEELREVVIRIGDGATWNDDSRYEPFKKGHGYKACQAYTEICSDIVNGKDVNGWSYYTVANRKNITADTIQQYDTLVIPSNIPSELHGVFVLYVDPTTGALLTTEGNCGGKTRTGWKLYTWDKVVRVERRNTSDSFTNPDLWW